VRQEAERRKATPVVRYTNQKKFYHVSFMKKIKKNKKMLYIFLKAIYNT